jgi:hypothetical protein
LQHSGDAGAWSLRVGRRVEVDVNEFDLIAQVGSRALVANHQTHPIVVVLIAPRSQRLTEHGFDCAVVVAVAWVPQGRHKSEHYLTLIAWPVVSAS